MVYDMLINFEVLTEKENIHQNNMNRHSNYGFRLTVLHKIWVTRYLGPRHRSRG